MDDVERGEVAGVAEQVDALAPCGLDCSRCLARRDGAIHAHALGLKAGLEGFAKVAPRFAAYDPAFAGYEAFDKVLRYLCQGSCTGCRTGNCLFAGCPVQPCVRRRGVDFCFQCPDFPCQAEGLPPALRSRWEFNNRRMAEVGPEAFLRETRDKPRY